MPLYSNTTFIPPIVPPGLEVTCPDPTICKDERIKIAEVEAAFEKFEQELSVQLCHNLTPIGKRVTGFPLTSEDFPMPGGSHVARSATTRTTLNSPFYINESLNLDNEMNETDFSNSGSLSSRTSAGRLPRRVVVAARNAPSFNSTPMNNLTPATSVRRPNAYTSSSSNARDPSSSLNAFITSWSTDSHTAGGTTTETESGETFIEPDEEQPESDVTS